MDQAERMHRPLAFDKMEGLVREMQDPETGVPVRSQKTFLSSIPAAFMGYDLIEWLMERLNIEESLEAVHIANQLCSYGYFFPVNDLKNLTVKDDGSLYRFQTPYYWPWQNKTPDNVDYAIYLVKRTLRNKQRHGLEEYETEALASLKKNLANKLELITMQAEEQVHLAKERKKGDKIVHDSQERAYWRVYRPPPGYPSSLESVPGPSKSNEDKGKRKSLEDLRKEVEFLKKSLSRTRVKVSVALENLIQHADTFTEYDAFFTPPQPSNPWLSDDTTFWQLNSPLVEVPTEKRVRRWALSMEEVMSDPKGVQEFTNYLRTEYSHENIRFCMAVNDLRRSAQSQIPKKVKEIYDEFLAPGAPCEINIDCKTMEQVQQEIKNPNRFTFDCAAEHIYALLLKKDTYPRFLRSDYYKNLLANAIQPSQRRRFFGFGGPAKKKSSTTAAPTTGVVQQQTTTANVQSQSASGGVSVQAGSSGTASGAAGGSGTSAPLSRRRGSDRSLTGSAHELAVCSVAGPSRVSHSHSQSNLSDIPYRGDLPCQSKESSLWSSLDPPGGSSDEADVSRRQSDRDDCCPWEERSRESPVSYSSPSNDQKSGKTPDDVWTDVSEKPPRKTSTQFDSASSSEVSLAIVDATDKLRRTCGIPQQSSMSGLDDGYNRRLSIAEARRASIAAPRSVDTMLEPTARPSVSSTDDSSSLMVTDTPVKLTTSDERTKKERKRSIASPAPMISVSSVVDDASVPVAYVDDKGGGKKESVVVVPDDHDDDVVNDSTVISSEPSSTSTIKDTPFKIKEDTVVTKDMVVPAKDKPQDVTVVCPWEDEESCKVDGPFVKKYATLGYL